MQYYKKEKIVLSLKIIDIWVWLQQVRQFYVVYLKRNKKEGKKREANQPLLKKNRLIFWKSLLALIFYLKIQYSLSS